jgi:hypothetical protein
MSRRPRIPSYRLHKQSGLELEISTMTATTTTRTPSNGQPRKTLASQLDRLDGILDGLDTALAGAVQEAVEQVVKQAVQAVLTEVLTNRELQEQLQQAAQHSPPPEEPHGKASILNRLWQATTENVRRTVQRVNRFGRGVGMAMVATGGVLAGIVYAAQSCPCRGEYFSTTNAVLALNSN